MHSLYFIIISTLIFASQIFSQITLKGTLTTDSGEKVPATRIVVSGAGEDETDSNGEFRIIVSTDFVEGEQVILKVFKENWEINHPLDGFWNLPNLKYQNVHTTRVIIVPHGSKALWSHARIEKYIAILSEKITKLEKEGNKPKEVEFGYYLKEWADKFGFTPDEVKSAFDTWAASDSVKNSNDWRTLGLRDFYQKNFAEAAINFEKAALQDETQLKEIEEAAQLKRLSAYQNWVDAGNSLYIQYRFQEALQKYQKADTLISSKEFPKQWADIRIYIGNSQNEIGIRIGGGRESNHLLAEAEAAYRQALEVYTRDQFPQQWAATQNNLGNVLKGQGKHVVGQESARLLAEAEVAFRQVLEVYTRDQFPQQWAATQNNLGNVLRGQGVDAVGQESAHLLAEAAFAFHQALDVFTRDQLPQLWAMTQNNLGLVLYNQGIRTHGEEGNRLLTEAAFAYRQALEVRTRDQLPQEWATTQDNLGDALSERGNRIRGEEGARLLAEAAFAYHQALDVFTRDQFPQLWAMIQNDLGLTLSNQGMHTFGQEGNRLLAEAEVAFRQALEVFTRDQLPHDWAETQNNLGIALCDQGIRTFGREGNRLLAEAVAAFHQALDVFTRDQLPQEWAATQNNLGFSLYKQGIRTHGEEGNRLLTEAEKAFLNALDIYSFEHLTYNWVQTQNNLAKLYEFQEEWQKAIDCYKNVSKIYPDDVAEKLEYLKSKLK